MSRKEVIFSLWSSKRVFWRSINDQTQMTKAKTIYAVMKNSVNIAWFYFSLKYNKKNIMMKVLRLMLYFLQAFSEVDNGNKHKQHQWNRNTTSVELAQKYFNLLPCVTK